MEMKATDLSARLLATENLTVVRARARTASFDIKSRVLTLPLWKDMTPEIEDMLVGHEVGHALYTGEKYIEPIKENKNMMSYMNVLEDVRIEKLIKRKYPGLRKRMNEGYKQLNDRDFFGIKQIQNLDELLLIDKINLYYKAGFQCGVTFTPEEKPFVVRAEQTETVDDVIALAKELYEFSKEEMEAKKEKSLSAEDGSDDDEGQEGDIDLDDLDEMDDIEIEYVERDSDDNVEGERNQPEKSEASKIEESIEEKLESKTEKIFQNKLDELADESTEYTYWKLDESYHSETVIGFKRILSETKTYEQWLDVDSINDYRLRHMSKEEMQNYNKKLSSDYESFKTESMRTVNYLVKEFEMKKSATLYKRAQVSKTGSLDMRKIYAYTIKDDLFKRVTTLPQGKNHGMVMLLDWSGSMDHVITDTIKQVINLTLFCQRVQIPFRVYAFTSNYFNHDQDHYLKVNEFLKNKLKNPDYDDTLNNATHFNLLELFSDKMSQTEFTSMSKRLLDYRFFINDGYALGSTPLNESLSWFYHNIGDFIKSYQLEKTTFITLTDGDGGSLRPLRVSSLNEYKYDENSYTRIKQKHLIRDDVTQKTYYLSNYSGDQSSMLLNMIKDRYDISIVGFYISSNHRSELMQFARSTFPTYTGDVYTLIDDWRNEFKRNGFASIRNTGRDELFLIPQSSTKIDDGELSVDSDASARTIAKNFSKYLNVKKTSRVLLNRFVNLVA
jgi:hypothetical protein